MKPSLFKVLTLFVVLAFAATMLAGFTWDDGAVSAAVQQQTS